MGAKRAITVRLDIGDYHRLSAEARRLAVSPATLMTSYLRAGLATSDSAADARRRIGYAVLDGLAALRERLPRAEPIDVVQIVREGRDELVGRTGL